MQRILDVASYLGRYIIWLLYGMEQLGLPCKVVRLFPTYYYFARTQGATLTTTHAYMRTEQCLVLLVYDRYNYTFGRFKW